MIPVRQIAVLAPLLIVAAACESTSKLCCEPSPVAPTDTSRSKTPPRLDSLPRALTALEKSAVTSGGEFTFALFREVNKRKPATNVFVSPLGAAVALAMTAQGSAGATDVAMRTTLGFSSQTLAQMGDGYRGLVALVTSLDSSVTVKSANAIWYRNGLAVQPSFVDVVQRTFNAKVSAANFDDEPATLAAINGWARDATNGKIDKVLDHIEKDHLMFLLDALYFKGAWREKFDAKLTAPGAFTTASGRASQVPLMRRTGSMRWTQGDGFQVVELPYGKDAFAMTILLPDAGRTADALATSLDAAAWTQLVSRLGNAQVDLTMPKFSFAYEDTWNDVLTTLGMGVAFSDRADFSRMVAGGGVTIGFVKENAFVDVNEDGTEAAAVTTIGIVPTSAPLTRVVRVDRPFLFAIRERLSGAILFMGKVDSL